MQHTLLSGRGGGTKVHNGLQDTDERSVHSTAYLTEHSPLGFGRGVGGRLGGAGSASVWRQLGKGEQSCV